MKAKVKKAVSIVLKVSEDNISAEFITQLKENDIEVKFL